MRSVLLLAVLALGLGGLTGCSDSTPAQSGNNVQAPPPQDSGSDKNAEAKGVGVGRLPKK